MPSPAKPCSVIGVSTTRPRTELLQQPLRDLVGALVLSDLFAHHEDVAIAAHLLGHRVAQGLANGRGDHRRALGHLRARRQTRPAVAAARRTASSRSRPASRRPCSRARRLRLCPAWCRRPSRGPETPTMVPADARGVLAVLGDHRDRRVDGHVLRPIRDQDLRQRALVDRLDLHRRLVGLDLGDDIAGTDAIAFLLQPLGQRALLHRRRQRRHKDVRRHVVRPVSSMNS